MIMEAITIRNIFNTFFIVHMVIESVILPYLIYKLIDNKNPTNKNRLDLFARLKLESTIKISIISIIIGIPLFLIINLWLLPLPQNILIELISNIGKSIVVVAFSTHACLLFVISIVRVISWIID